MNTRMVCILQMTADGQSTEDIAHELRLRPNSVKNLRNKLLGLMGADNIAHAVAQGFRQGILR